MRKSYRRIMSRRKLAHTACSDGALECGFDCKRQDESWTHLTRNRVQFKEQSIPFDYISKEIMETHITEEKYHVLNIWNSL